LPHGFTTPVLIPRPKTPPAHPQRARFEVHIGPLESENLALPQSRSKSDRPPGTALAFGSSQKRLHLFDRVWLDVVLRQSWCFRRIGSIPAKSAATLCFSEHSGNLKESAGPIRPQHLAWQAVVK
jgi:hypothetical protein